MSRFYFDLHDGQHETKDEEGTEFPNSEAVRKAALKLLPDLAREIMPKDGDRRDVIVDVRDETGRLDHFGVARTR